MQILHVISSVDVRSGGTATAFVKLATTQARAGLRVTAAVTYRKGEDFDLAVREMTDAGIQVRMFGPAIGPIRWVRGMRRELRTLIKQSDVVHIHALWEEIQHQAAGEARRAGVPTVITPHGMLDPWSLAQRSWKKNLCMKFRVRRHLNDAAAIHVTAGPEYELIRPMGLTPPALVETLGVDFQEFENLPPHGWLRERCTGIGDRPIVLFLSRLHPKKGLELLIPAFAAAQTNGAALVLAGPAEPGYEAVLKKLVVKHGLEDRVFFTGMLHGPERIRAYVDADLFVLPSYQENFGIVIAESLAAGTPVIISNKINICDLIAAAGVGAVVTTEVQPLTAALSRWMGDPNLRAAAAAKARPFAWTNFDWAEIGRRWVTHYTQIASRSPSKDAPPKAALQCI